METHAKNFVYHRPDIEITQDEVTTLRCNYVITCDEEFHLYLVKDIYRYFLEERTVSVFFDKLPEQTYDVIYEDDPFSFVSEGSLYAIVLGDGGDHVAGRGQLLAVGAGVLRALSLIHI